MGGGGGDFCHSRNAQKSQNSLDILPNLNKPYHKPYALCLLSILCIHWGIASYQPFIDTALILLCGGIIAIIIDNKGDLKLSFYKSRFLIISVAFAAISYKIVLDILKKLDIVQNIYNNQMTPFSDLPEHILKAIETSFKHLFSYNEPFMPLSMNVCFVLFVAVILVLLLATKINKGAKIIITILLMVAIVASQTHIILSKTIANGIVIEYYGLLFLRVLIVALVFKFMVQFVRTQALLQSFVFALSCVFVWICIVQDLEAQKAHKIAMDRDFRFLNRIINRIEQNENFSYNKQYCGVMFGEIQNETTKNFIANLFPSFHMQPVFRYTMPKDIFAKCTIYNDLILKHQDYKNNKKYTSGFSSLISRLHKAGILDKLEPFPHKDSVVVFENIIVFVASRGNLDEIRASVKAQDNGAAR